MRLRSFNNINCGSVPPNKVEFTSLMMAIIEENWKTMPAEKLARALGIHKTVLRMKLYEMGYKKMEMEYWTEEQTQFLMDNYKAIGDVELAEIFNKKWPKKKDWTNKHIDKKRNYLGLARTKEEIKAIWQRHVAAGKFATIANYSASVNLTDNWVAFTLAGKNRYKELKDELLKRPDLLELHRQTILLKRELKKAKDGRQQPES